MVTALMSSGPRFMVICQYIFKGNHDKIDFFSSFHSTICSPGLTIPRSKNLALSESVYFLIFYPTNICQICYFLFSQGALNVLLWGEIFGNINVGKIGNILSLQLWHHGWIRHHLNWIEIKTSYYPKILLNGYLQ